MAKDLGFTPETIPKIRLDGKLRCQDFYRDNSVIGQVLSLVHTCHATTAGFFENMILSERSPYQHGFAGLPRVALSDCTMSPALVSSKRVAPMMNLALYITSYAKLDRMRIRSSGMLEYRISLRT
jgi:hypothetical protein